jgi:hypothetical protein
MALPLVTRDSEGFTVSHAEVVFSGLPFVLATQVAQAVAAGHEVFACSWAVEVRGHAGPHEFDDEYGECHRCMPFVEGPRIENCGAPAVADERGFRCAAGHEHVSMQARHDEGWDYFDDDEIAGMRQGGLAYTGVRDMAGRVVL